MKKVRSRTSEESAKEVPTRATRALIPLVGDDVAPRFDLAPEALIVAIKPDGRARVEKSIVLPQASAEALCGLIILEKVDVVICCAIEEEYYQYLTWKKVKVIDSVMGPYSDVLERVAQGTIPDEEILVGRKE